ncbi:MAG: GNAT family N-acetyltransferase [Cyanobacteriota bacterium]
MPHSAPERETQRLYLQPFQPDDLDALAALYAKPDVMRYVGHGVRTREETQTGLHRMMAHWQAHGFGMWKLIEKGTGAFVGRAGLIYLDSTPEIEVGYALDRPFWGRGLATEAARASLQFGFDTLELERIVAIARPENRASQRVMQKLGMTYEKDAFYYNCEVVYWAIARRDFLP